MIVWIASTNPTAAAIALEDLHSQLRGGSSPKCGLLKKIGRNESSFAIVRDRLRRKQKRKHFLA